jgi:hypothetical protein
MNQTAQPTDQEIDAAARVLYEEGSFNHWWPATAKSYDDLVASDPIAASEFGGIVERVLMAAARVRL